MTGQKLSALLRNEARKRAQRTDSDGERGQKVKRQRLSRARVELLRPSVSRGAMLGRRRSAVPRVMFGKPYNGPISLLVTESPDESMLPIGTLLSVSEAAELTQVDPQLMAMHVREFGAIDAGRLRIEIIHDEPDGDVPSHDEWPTF